MKIRSLATILAAFALTACGASDPAPQSATQPVQAEPAKPAQGDHAADNKAEAHKHNFPGAIDTFHTAMAGLWHAEKGPERTQKTCDAVPTLKTHALAIVSADVPEKAAANAEAYKKAAAGLVVNLDALRDMCAVDGRADFEASFHAVHEAFHGIVKNLGHEKHEGAKHKHGEHKGHDGAHGEHKHHGDKH